MRFTGIQLWAFVALTGCAGAQAAPTPSATPAPATQDRAERERQVAERARQRSEQVRQRAERTRLRADSARARALARAAAADSALQNRASLGVTLSSTGTRRDTLGIFVSAVAEGGPAERAGIVEGDRIAAINGVDVRTQASDADDSYLAGVAQRRFTLELRKLTPGARANLRVWSGGRYRDVQVTTARYTEVYRNRRTSIRIGDGTWAPGFAPEVVAPLMPGRIELRSLPRVAPLRRLDLDAKKLQRSAEDLVGAVVGAGEAVATALAPLTEIDAIREAQGIAPLADIEDAFIGIEPMDFQHLEFEPIEFEHLDFGPLEFEPLDIGPMDFNFDLEYELDDHAPWAIEIEDLSVEALRQAEETLGRLEIEVSLR